MKKAINQMDLKYHVPAFAMTAETMYGIITGDLGFIIIGGMFLAIWTGLDVFKIHSEVKANG
jgi:hypothetical protein